MTANIDISVGTFHGSDVVAIPFRDKRYALILFTRPDTNLEDERAYFSTTAFRAKTSFTPVFLNIHLPRLRVSKTEDGCEVSCGEISATRALSLSLDEGGAGAAPILPHSIGKLFTPGSGLVYPNGPVNGRREIYFDRPFYLAIMNVESQRVLLDGIITDPTR
jgi:hypothetical protein